MTRLYVVARWSSAGKLAAVPRHESIEGIAVSHPRTLFVPRLAHGAWGPLYAASIAPAVRRYRGKVDVVLGSWAYPDGFAAILAARLLGLPCVVKLHGSDINVMAKLPGPRRWLDITPRTDRDDMTDPADIADSNDSTENADPMLNADAKDPTDPTDKAEPTEPMDRTEPRDPMDKTESCDHKDHFDDGLIGPFSMPTAQAGGAMLAILTDRR